MMNASGSSGVTLVFVNGFLAPEGNPIPSHLIPPNYNIICVSPSPTGSYHDRVCQIFYELKGGTVDYGQEHSDYHGHNRYGHHYPKGKYSQWSASNPIVLLGHSLGGMTCWVLQNYLAAGKFPGHDTDASWVKSLITLNAPLNGTIRVYEVGISLRQPPMQQWLSPGFWICFFVHLGECFNFRPLLDLDQRQWMVWLGSPHSWLLCLLMLCGYGMHSATDNAAYDTTIHSNLVWNHALQTYDSTFYYSIAGTVNRPVDEDIHIPSDLTASTTATTIYSPSSVIGLFKAIGDWIHLPSKPSIAGIRTDHWLSTGTDGMVSLHSQEYPRISRRFDDAEYVQSIKDKVDLGRGKWYFTHRQISHVCASFDCERTWSYVFHVVNELERRHESQSTEHYAGSDAGSKHCKEQRLLQLFQPDRQEVPLHVTDCHESDGSGKTWPWLLPVRLMLLVTALTVQLWQFFGLRSLLTTSSVELVLILSLPVLIPVALVSRLVTGSDWSSEVNIRSAHAIEISHAIARLSIVVLFWQKHLSLTALWTAIAWSSVLETVVNLTFHLSWTSCLRTGLKSAVTYLFVHQCVTVDSIWFLVSIVAQQCICIIPSALWLTINCCTSELDALWQSTSPTRATQIAYGMGIVCVLLTTCITVNLFAVVSLLDATLADQQWALALLIATVFTSWHKFAEFGHASTFVLMKARFLHHRLHEWKSGSELSCPPMRMLVKGQ